MKNQTTKRAKKRQNGVIDELKKRKGRKERNIDSGFIRVNGGEKSLIGPHNKKEQKNLSFLIWLSLLPSCKSLLKTRKKENYRNSKWRIQHHRYISFFHFSFS